MAKDLSFIEESILDKVPEEFKNLDGSASYALIKTGATRPNPCVVMGDTVKGSLAIIDVRGFGPGVRVCSYSDRNDYIRTSPIVRVEKTITDETGLIEIQFQTEGGFYTLRKL